MSQPASHNSISWETTACPLCGETRSTPILRASDLLYRAPGEFSLVRCDACWHVFLNPRPTRECIGAFYPVDYGPFRGSDSAKCRVQSAECKVPGERRARSAFDPRSWRWLRRLVLSWIESRAIPIPNTHPSSLTPRPRALELGCSHGAFLIQLRELGWECVGIEPAAEVAARAVEHGFDVRVGSLEAVVAADPQTFTPNSFDAVFAWMVVEHLHDPVATLRIARELLKPGGTLSFSVPNFGCWERRAFGQF